ncbi:MAG: DUF1343 domain-containing protein [Fimbriimonadaceae bacterium]|nr:DUF1343 domain-containing protein [Chitinophagales bacterium]
MIQLISILSWICFFTGCKNPAPSSEEGLTKNKIHLIAQNNIPYDITIITGAEQTEKYLPLLKDKYVALVVNQTSVIGTKHLVDTLSQLGVNIPLIFAPEHGFRGTEDAGATINNSKDIATGISIISLYGNKKKPSKEDLQDVDVVIFDIQDVGARFYTYISTLHYIMEACAENKKQLIILDRPNPNGFYVDGPVLKKEFSSFVGMHPVPVVHGMTIGEYAQMINTEHWLPNNLQCELQIIPCENYEHKDYYEVKIPPSPNLKSMQAIYLYPSLCFFEGTNVSVGSGTDKPFEMFGSPFTEKTDFFFTPKSMAGSKTPPFMNQLCYGYDLSKMEIEKIKEQKINISYFIDAYNRFSDKNNFFLSNNFFNKLAGTDVLMQQIKAGLSEAEIKLSWQDDLQVFKEKRKKYLLYKDFE